MEEEGKDREWWGWLSTEDGCQSEERGKNIMIHTVLEQISLSLSVSLSLSLREWWGWLSREDGCQWGHYDSYCSGTKLSLSLSLSLTWMPLMLAAR